jgi:tetratricopeptide (TPR) repeat protein
LFKVVNWKQSCMSEVTASRLKEEGNEAYRCGLHEEAIARFSDAIKLDPKNETLFCNRSMCYAALRDWSKSAADAKESIALSQKYVKAHYRLVKAQLELQSYKDARLNLLYAIHLCGDCKELKMLEAEILLKTKIPLRPKSTDFEVIEDLGEGNFSKIYKVSLKSTGEIYAMKVHQLFADTLRYMRNYVV